MKRRTRAWMVSLTMALGLAAGVALPLGSALADPPGSGFVYQGQVKRNAALVTGLTDLRFTLFDAASGGNRMACPRRAALETALDLSDNRQETIAPSLAW